MDPPLMSCSRFGARRTYLRVVCGPTGRWDALDQLDDTPAAEERVVVYAMVSGPTHVHIQRRVQGRRVCGWYQGGDYRVLVEQPADDVLRSTARWRAWVAEQVGYPITEDGFVVEVNEELRTGGQ